MELRIVGAGLGRTGTNSLKLAIEQLLGGRCYHMFELVQRPPDLPAWEAAVRGEDVDWRELLRDYVATVDWPGAAFWRAIHAHSPRALVLLSMRDSAEAWWASMERTIVAVLDTPAEDPHQRRRRAMVRELLSRHLGPDWRDPAAAMAAYERHLDEVRSGVPARLLIEWRAGDGWEPICERLGVPVPDSPFPHENRMADFRAAAGLAEEPAG
jgi:Sulfotransferase domain